MGLSLSSWNLTADRSPLTKPPQNITDSLYQSCWRMLQKSERSPRQKLLRDSRPSHVLSVMLLSSVWRQGDNSGVLWQIPIGLWSTQVAYLRSCCHVLQGVYSVSAAGSLPSYSPPDLSWCTGLLCGNSSNITNTRQHCFLAMAHMGTSQEELLYLSNLCL